MPRGDPVDGVGIVGDLDAEPGQLVPKAYRPRTGGRRRRRQRRHPLGQLLRTADQWLPDPLSPRRVERRESLAAASVEDGQALAVDAGLAQRQADRVEAADAIDRQAEAGAEPAGGGDPDPQPGEGAGTETDGDRLDLPPAPGGRGGRLDLGQQRGRVPGPPVSGEPQQRLVQSLTVAPGAGGGVGGRGIEADERQRSPVSSP
ncbi:MAG TPA: hypothetical protein VHU86_03105 [Solirubrobacterales bacterium]|nr:hypothetical protein [Solirubrobacterales bacterium]